LNGVKSPVDDGIAVKEDKQVIHYRKRTRASRGRYGRPLSG
jgi:hypothetical protein